MSKRSCEEGSHGGKRLNKTPSVCFSPIKAPTALVFSSNPFNDLDNATIDHILSFIDASGALQLAKCNRRLFNVHQQSRNLRLSRRFDIVITEFSQNQNVSWELRLSDRTVNKLNKPLFINFIEETIEDPDFELIEGTLTMRVKFDKSSHSDYKGFLYWPSTLKNTIRNEKQSTLNCHVVGGDERLGTLAVLKFLQDHLALDQLSVDKDDDAEMLDFLTHYPLPLVRHLHVFPSDKATEAQVLQLVQVFPQLNGLSLTLKGRQNNFSVTFYQNSNIRQLQTFAIFGKKCEADVSQMKWQNFVAPKWQAPRWIAAHTVRLEPIKKIVDEWKNDQRDIGFWAFCVNVRPFSDYEVAAKIGAGRKAVYCELNNWKGVVKSKSGKVLRVRIRTIEDGVKAIDLTTIVDKKKFWRDFVHNGAGFSWENLFML